MAQTGTDPEPGRRSGRKSGLETDPAGTVWQELLNADSVDTLAGPWLRVVLAKADAGMGAIFLADDTREAGNRLIAAEGPDAERELATIAAQTIATGRAGMERVQIDSKGVRLSQPLTDRTLIIGAVVILIRDPSPREIRNATRSLLWDMAWLRERLARDEQNSRARYLAALKTAHEIFAAALDDHEFRQAALGSVTRLATAASAERVSLGFVKNDRVALAAVSNSAQFGKRMSLTHRVTAAMEEAIDQRAALSHPAPADEINGTRAHEELAHAHGPSSVLTIPFLGGETFLGAMTFERPIASPFTPEELAHLDFAVNLVGPVLWEKSKNDKALIFKVGDTLRNQTRRLLGPGHIGRKLAALALTGTVALFALWTQPYRVTADAVVEGAIERNLVAPFDGFVREAPHRAGDLVKAGSLVAGLDKRELALERLRWMTEKQQKTLEYGRAVGERKRADAEIIKTQIAQAEAQIGMIDARLDRAEIVAPFDGVIVTGDLSQNIGGSVSRGDVLFVMAPVDDYRVVLKVDESRIADIRPDQPGDLILTALPETEFAIGIEKLTPIAIAEDGRNFFRVEAKLRNDATGIGTGMQGVAKIEIESRLVVDNWTREFRDWLRLRLWTWFG